jgi:hypothetical protein
MDDSDSSDDDHHVQDDDTDYDDDDDEELAAAAAAERIRLKLISLLQRKGTYPKRTRKKIDRLAADFLDETESDIYTMLCEQYPYADDYGGLDSDRDTEEEVEAAICFFPEMLSRRSNLHMFFPIQCISLGFDDRTNVICNLKAVSFIPLVARLATEFGCFDEASRGGLLYGNASTPMKNIMCSDPTLRNVIRDNRKYSELVDDKHHELVDDKCLLVIQKLRQMSLLKKEDI